LTPNGSRINKYIRNQKEGLDAYRGSVVTRILNLEQELSSVTTDELERMHKDRELSDEDYEQVKESVNEWENSIKITIERTSEASSLNTLNAETRFYRMVSNDYLKNALGIKSEKTADQVNQLNKMAGTVIQDKGFMSTGFKADENFFASEDHNLPVMLTLLADKGQKCFVTANITEGEVIFDKGTKYVILGAYAHGKNGKRVPVTNYSVDSALSDVEVESTQVENELGDIPTNKKRLAESDAFNNKTGLFKGIEIVAKIIKE
ncbi:MAG: hypothetical protein K6F00_00705, partial [Lachnospiraceae bacterium]|nr:hypothetical protein [Lachnospiraceae bacterium]